MKQAAEMIPPTDVLPEYLIALLSRTSPALIPLSS
jgi:hypothetical protein